MEQRRVRLGDIVDDYCPRERRLTNHAVVAMIEDQIKQTRCTTCDAEHPYKQAKVPPKRKRTNVAALTQEVLERATDAPRLNGHEEEAAPPAAASEAPPLSARAAGELSHEEPAREERQMEEDGPVHRPLIRATLPRLEGQVPARQAPDFTLRLPGARLGQFKHQLGPGFLPDTRQQKPARGGQRHAQQGGQHRAFGHGGRSHGRFGNKKSPR
jgi:hypothetical protein